MRAHQASRIALKVSRALLFAADDSRRAGLLPPGSVQTTEALLRAAGMLDDWQVRVYRSSRLRRLRSWGEDKILPGATTHLALRKRVMDDETRIAIEAGATQVLVVGAGFDTLGLRLATQFPSVRFVEIDHPATQSLKRHALEQLGSPDNLVLHPADLAEASLPEAADELGWDRDQRAVVIVEGILRHIAEPDVADFLRGVSAVMGPGSRLLGTYLLPDAQGRPQAGRLAGIGRASRRAIGEPLQWAVTHEDLSSLLAEIGFELRDEPGHVDLRLRYLVPSGLDELPLATNEQILIADLA